MGYQSHQVRKGGGQELQGLHIQVLASALSATNVGSLSNPDQV